MRPGCCRWRSTTARAALQFTRIKLRPSRFRLFRTPGFDHAVQSGHSNAEPFSGRFALDLIFKIGWQQREPRYFSLVHSAVAVVVALGPVAGFVELALPLIVIGIVIVIDGAAARLRFGTIGHQLYLLFAI